MRIDTNTPNPYTTIFGHAVDDLLERYCIPIELCDCEKNAAGTILSVNRQRLVGVASCQGLSLTRPQMSEILIVLNGASKKFAFFSRNDGASQEHKRLEVFDAVGLFSIPGYPQYTNHVTQAPVHPVVRLEVF